LLALVAGDDLGLGLQVQAAQLVAQAGVGAVQLGHGRAEGTQLLLQAGTVDRHFAGVVDQVVQQVGAHAHLLLRCARSGGVLGDRGRFLVFHRRRQRRQGLGGGGQLDRLGNHRLRCGGDRLCGDGWLRLLDGGGGHRGGGLRLDRGGRRVQGRNGFAADTGLERRDQRGRPGPIWRRQRRQGLGGGGQLDRLGNHRLRCGGDRLCGDGWLRLLDGGGGHRGGGLRLDRGGRRVQGRNGFAADTGLERRDQRVRHGRGAVGTGLHQQLVQGVEATLQQLDVVAVQVGAVFGGGFQQ